MFGKKHLIYTVFARSRGNNSSKDGKIDKSTFRTTSRGNVVKGRYKHSCSYKCSCRAGE
ncbi:uncharacterized protein METZ01_LOCUS274187 [marine metagenome]|uniref:Uncharacterized protein n=1 Tax=marine metagenome TaxID=408172 RepID=A0A382KCV5_9ZZZZ